MLQTINIKKTQKLGKKLLELENKNTLNILTKLITKYIISKVYLDKPDKKIIW